MSKQPEYFLKVSEAAGLLGVTRWWLTRHVKDLGIRRIGQQLVRADVEQAAQNLKKGNDDGRTNGT